MGNRGRLLERQRPASKFERPSFPTEQRNFRIFSSDVGQTPPLFAALLFLCGKKDGVSRRLCADSGPWLERENEAISLGFSPGIFWGKAKAGEDLNFSLCTCGIKSFFPRSLSFSKVKFVNSHLPRVNVGRKSVIEAFFSCGKTCVGPEIPPKVGERRRLFLKKKDEVKKSYFRPFAPPPRPRSETTNRLFFFAAHEFFCPIPIYSAKLWRFEGKRQGVAFSTRKCISMHASRPVREIGFHQKKGKEIHANL